MPLGDRTVDLRDVTCPVLSMTGEHDHLVPPASSDPLADALISTTVDEVRLRAGHTGLFVGRQAQATGIPAMLEWIERHSETARSRARRDHHL